MSSSPLPIRPRAATQQELLAAHNRRHDGLAATPGGAHLYGTTPGGTRIVYSREQLLALASSPLSATPPRGLGASGIPSEISRSPGSGDAAAFSSSFGAAGTSLGRSPEKSSLRNTAALNRAMNIGAGSSAAGSSPPASRSPLGATPRSPGSAFNFSGPVSPSSRRYPSAGGSTAPSGISAQRPTGPTSPTAAKPNSSSPPRAQAGGEQFAMDI